MDTRAQLAQQPSLWDRTVACTGHHGRDDEVRVRVRFEGRARVSPGQVGWGVWEKKGEVSDEKLERWSSEMEKTKGVCV